MPLLKCLRWSFALAGVVGALTVVWHEGKQAAAGHTSYFYSLFGQELLGFVFGGVFGLGGYVLGSFAEGFIERFLRLRRGGDRRSEAAQRIRGKQGRKKRNSSSAGK